MPKKKQPASKTPVKPERIADEENALLRYKAWLAQKEVNRKLIRLEETWIGGSVPALVDALILCHQSQAPLPLWIAKGAIKLIKMLFVGKKLSKHATNLQRTHRIDYARWEAVKELAERREEMLYRIARLSVVERDTQPEFAALAVDYTIDQRFAAVSELFRLSNNPAWGTAKTIRRSYKLVEHDMRHGESRKYDLPNRANPLTSAYDTL